MYSVVIPYLSNSKCIDTCLEYLEKNSRYEHEIVPIVDETDVYYAFNKGVYTSKYETVVLFSDDMMAGKDWDIFIPEHAKPDTVLTCYVVEPDPGRMMSGPECVKCDCGDSPDNFDYEKFQAFADEGAAQVPDIRDDSLGWYMPVVFNQKTFVSYPNIGKFPYVANDITLFHYILPNLGFKFKQMKSFIYHFQRKATKQNYPSFR